MLEIEKPRIECIERSEDNCYAKLIVEPLERGYGITSGNSLRRILLSSLSGSAVTSVKIEGLLHESSTIPGVLEDVTDLGNFPLRFLRAIHQPITRLQYQFFSII